MNDWMEPFLKDCIGKLPDSAYREQVKKELTDHLETLAAELEKSGHTPQEARQLALGQMGDPSELARTFEEESLRRQPVDVGHFVIMSFAGCLIAGFLYLFTTWPVGLLLGFRNLGPLLPVYRLIGPVLYRAIFGCCMFLLPFGITARFLAEAFHGPHQKLLVTCGLWLPWLGEKVIAFLFGGVIYSHYHIRDLLTFIRRISSGGDGFAPWFTVPYILLAFAACPLLAYVASRRENARARKRSAA